MYCGDGKLSKDLTHLAYVSKDRDIAKFILNFFQKRLNIEQKDITLTLTYKNLPINSREKWVEELGIDEDKINLYKYERYKSEALFIQINGTVIRQLFGKIIDKILISNFIRNEKLRRAFLRGLFAADGGIGIKRKENYINQMSYHFSISETKLINLCCKALMLEKICFKTETKPKTNSKNIIILNWSNYWKLWKIKAFELCKRKRLEFLKIAKGLKVGCLIAKEMRKQLFDSPLLQQREIAKKLGTYQASVCRMRQGYFYPTIEQLLILSRLSNTSVRKIKNNVKKVRVGNSTYIEDPSFLDFIFDLKLI